MYEEPPYLFLDCETCPYRMPNILIQPHILSGGSEMIKQLQIIKHTKEVFDKICY